MNGNQAIPPTVAPTKPSHSQLAPQIHPSPTAPLPCFHGGTFFEDVGEEFDNLDRRHAIINADVLDAWFPPSPQALAVVQEHLPWLLQTSPPTHCAGFLRAIARSRGVPEECLLPGAGSSDLIFRVFTHWLTPSSRVLILDPTYGEYVHVLEHVIGCRVDRFPLRREDRYRPDLDAYARFLTPGFDLAVLVNPNSPTGQFIPASDLASLLNLAPERTTFWIDETYIDFVDSNESLERFAAASKRVFVCKSMSKAYALSGARAAYLCGPGGAISSLRAFTPPWTVSLPAQVAAVRALADADYYRARWRETRTLRDQLAKELQSIPGLNVLEGVANFLLVELPVQAPPVSEVLRRCAAHGLHLRDVSSMGAQLVPGTVRVAVKDAPTNRRIAQILRHAFSAV